VEELVEGMVVVVRMAGRKYIAVVEPTINQASGNRRPTMNNGEEESEQNPSKPQFHPQAVQKSVDAQQAEP